MVAVYPGIRHVGMSEKMRYTAILEHFMKGTVDSASFYKLPEVLAISMSDKGDNVQVVTNVVISGKNKGKDKKIYIYI